MRVMQSFPVLRETTNPYLKQLFTAVSSEVLVTTFSWRRALLGRFDVLHIHWPELMLRSPSSLRRWLRRVAFVAVLLRIRFSKRALVRTVHNPFPHEPGSSTERVLLRLADRWTSLFVLLVRQTPPPVSDAPAVVIPHGHYRDWFANTEIPTSETGHLVYIGLVRRYKGVDRLLDVFSATNNSEDETLSLRIVGGVSDPELAALIGAAVAADSRISVHLEYVSDYQLAQEVGRAELVVLPYREMHNSGAALLALSLGRPVLVPANEITLSLAREVGGAWVQTYSDDLSPEILIGAVTAVRAGLTSPPRLADRAWPAIGAAHAVAYRQSLNTHHGHK